MKKKVNRELCKSIWFISITLKANVALKDYYNNKTEKSNLIFQT